MKEINKIDRQQLIMLNLEAAVDQNSLARVIDAFLDFALQEDLGFSEKKNTTGRPAYPTRTLLAIYLYGYLHKTRSSRDLEKLCKNNIELWWLVCGHQPCFKTIADFRKVNKKAFRNLFVLFRDFCASLNLYGKSTIAVDGSKFRAQNSKKNNFNRAKIERHLEHIERTEAEYLEQLDQQDKAEANEKKTSDKRVKQLRERKKKYNKLQSDLESSGERQISTTDPDARLLPQGNRVISVGYNVQSAVDDKNMLIAEYEVINEKDTDALASLAIKTKKALQVATDKSMDVLADKGYHKGEQLQACHDNNINTLVAHRDSAVQKMPKEVRKDTFKYDNKKDEYRCPKGKVLKRQGEYTRKKEGKEVANFTRYMASYSDCERCDFFKQCLSASKKKSRRGRSIDRYEYEDAIERNKAEVESRKTEYRRRQAIVEHPFGTIKRGWGMDHTLMKGMDKVTTEFSIIMLCYNFRRVVSILGIKEFKKALRRLCSNYLPCKVTRSLLLLKIICGHHSQAGTVVQKSYL